mmetsp:Transcript_156334/g.291743  ORF Transcript_156334/g.291743 Transcript_156334/m.291743 type:complete len:210 (-) Transcript_156334:209-838(-)
MRRSKRSCSQRPLPLLDEPAHRGEVVSVAPVGEGAPSSCEAVKVENVEFPVPAKVDTAHEDAARDCTSRTSSKKRSLEALRAGRAQSCDQLAPETCRLGRPLDLNSSLPNQLSSTSPSADSDIWRLTGLCVALMGVALGAAGDCMNPCSCGSKWWCPNPKSSTTDSENANETLVVGVRAKEPDKVRLMVKALSWDTSVPRGVAERKLLE